MMGTKLPYIFLLPLTEFEIALDVFGANKVTCGFIGGVESLDETKEAIRYLT